MALNDSVNIQILWMRRLFYEVDQSGLIEVAVRVQNTGSNPWNSPTYRVRSHLILPDGHYVRDPDGGALFAGTLDPNETTRVRFSIFSAPRTLGVTPALLFHPDTVVVVGLVQEGVGWINSTDVARVADCLDSHNSSFVVQAARAELVNFQAYGSVVTESDVSTLVDSISAGPSETVYLMKLTCSARENQRVEAYFTDPVLDTERPIGFVHVPDGDTRDLDLGLLKLTAASRLRVAIPANGAGGRVDAVLKYIRLPWVDGALFAPEQ